MEVGLRIVPTRGWCDFCEVCLIVQLTEARFLFVIDNCGDQCLGFQEDYFAWESLGIGRSLVFLFAQAVFYWSIIVIIETKVFVRLFYACRPKIYVNRDEEER